MAYEYIKRTYGLTFVPGQRVRHSVTGGDGTVKREAASMGHYVMVAFDGRKHASPCHPEELTEIGAAP